MKKRTKIALAAAGGLLMIGLIFTGAAVALGADISGMFMDGFFNVGQGFYMDFSGVDMDNDYKTSGEYAVSADGIEEIRLEWSSGEVEARAYGGEEIKFSESASSAISQDDALRFGVGDGKLCIQYCKNGRYVRQRKSITLLVPESMMGKLDTLYLGSSSADITASGLRAEKLRMSTASGSVTVSESQAEKLAVSTAGGNLELEGSFGSVETDGTSGEANVRNLRRGASIEMTTVSGDMTVSGDYSKAVFEATSGKLSSKGDFSAESVSVDSVSGGMEISGTVGRLEADTTSGDVWLESDVCPDAEISTVSGCVYLALPGDSGFELEFDTVSGKLDSDIQLGIRGDDYVCGDGSREISVETTSGDIKIAEK